jgi:tetratricopeptide (TPR) repeat protein
MAMTQKLFGLAKPVEKDIAAQANQPPQESKETAQSTAAASQTPVPAESVKQETPGEEKKIFPAEAEEMSRSTRPEYRPHAFVVMPFGKKKGADGSPYDFNAIYKTLIKPALEEAGFEPFRADEETASGDILTDMFQELLLADLVLCDLSIDNANAFYELGIRHAFRKRGVMHIQAGRAYMPFDIFNVRTLPYHITTEGVPDPAFLRADITAIARMAKDTWASDRDAVHSPIFNLLTGLKEPDRTLLRTPLATGFWREYNEWKERITVAKRQRRIGDILLLTEEIRNPMIKEEAIGEAGKALASMGRNELALIQYRKGLEVNSSNMDFRRQEAFHLNRLGRVDEAIIKIESLLADFPNDSEAVAYLGRIYKEMWFDSWKEIKDKAKRMKAAFDSYHWLIKSIDIYLKGYRIDLDNYYPGVNALTLSTIAIHLADLFGDKKAPDPDIERIRDGLDELRGALIFALEARTDDYNADYWTLVSLAELLVLSATNVASVTRAYRKALTASRRDLSYLNSSVSQLKILHALGMREEYVQCGLKILTEELQRVDKDNLPASKSKIKKPTGQVFLFSGYMVDHDGKEHKTFPADKENEIRAEIKERLKKFNANPNDIGYIAGLSAGSEIIFAEVCAEMGICVKVYLPLPETAYIREFVAPGGDDWVDRFYKVRDHPLVDENYQSERIGLPKPDDDPYERNNRWALYSSLGRGVDKVRLLALWNGRSGRMKDRDARLVKHMVDLTRENGISVELINTSKYIHGLITGAYDGLPDIRIPQGGVVGEVKSKVKSRRKK